MPFITNRLRPMANLLHAARRGSVIMEYQVMVMITVIGIGGVAQVGPGILPYYEKSSTNIERANEVKFNPNITLGDSDDDFSAIVVVSPGKANKNGNNGHGNDADKNDDSNPGNSNDPFDFTDDDGTPGKSDHLQIDDSEIHFACFDEGLVAAGHVKFQNLNNFGAGFCLHGNKSVRLGNQNAFTQGSVVSSSTLHKVTAGDQTTGLQDALTIAYMGVNIDDTIKNVTQDLLDPSRRARPSILDATLAPIELDSNVVLASHLTKGAVHTYLCRQNQTLTFHNSALRLQDVALITDCPIALPDGFTIEDAVVISLDTSNKSIQAQGVQIGREDDCAVGGSAQLLSQGSITITGVSEIHGSHMIASNNITMDDVVTGVGALVLSGGTVNGTSTTMFACGTADNEDSGFSLYSILLGLISET